MHFHFTSFTQDFDKDDKIRIGLVLDGKHQSFMEIADEIQLECDALLGTKYKELVFPENKKIVSDFTVANIEQAITKSLQDPEVDILIGIGTVTAIALADWGELPKPTIVIGIIHPQFQEIPLTEKQTSGVFNFTYITLPFSPRRDLELFQSILPFKNLGILFSENILRSIPKDKSARHYFDNTIENMDFDYRIIPVSMDSLSFENLIPDDLDAIYTGLFFDFSRDRIKNIYQIANKKGIPSFALGGVDYVEMGAMASVSAENVQQRVSRRTALNMEKILKFRYL